MNPVFPSMILCEWQEHKGAYLLLCTPTTLLYACAYKLQQHIVLLRLCRAPRWKPLPLSSCSPEFAQNTLKYIEAWLLLQTLLCCEGLTYFLQDLILNLADISWWPSFKRRTKPSHLQLQSGARSSLWSSTNLPLRASQIKNEVNPAPPANIFRDSSNEAQTNAINRLALLIKFRSP